MKVAQRGVVRCRSLLLSHTQSVSFNILSPVFGAVVSTGTFRYGFCFKRRGPADFRKMDLQGQPRLLTTNDILLCQTVCRRCTNYT